MNRNQKNFVIVCDLLSTFLRFRRFLASEIRMAGYNVTVIAGADDAEDHQFFIDQGIDYRIIPMNRTGLNPFADRRYCRQLFTAFEEFNPEHVLAYQAKAAVWAAVAARKLDTCKVTILFPGLGYLFAPSQSFKQSAIQFIARRLYRYAFRSIDTAIFQNSDDIESLKKARVLSSKTDIVLVNGSGVHLDQFPATQPPKQPIRFVMATRLLADKGIREFAEVAGRIHEQYPNRAEFQLAGRIDSNPTAIKSHEIREWESLGWLTFRGHITDMPSYLQESSVFVLPSYYMEGTPRSILEALSSGRAVVTTDNRGCRETVEDGVNGFMIPQRDSDALGEALIKYIENPELIQQHGEASRRLAETRYDVNIVNQQMFDAMGIEPKKETK